MIRYQDRGRDSWVREEGELDKEFLIAIGHLDLGGVLRGEAVPYHRISRNLMRGVGWDRSKAFVTPFGTPFEGVAADSDELLLLPDQSAMDKIRVQDTHPAESLVLADIVHADEKPWAGCPRGFLKRALDSLFRETGLTVVGAFKQHFFCDGAPDQEGPAFRLDGLRDMGPLNRAMIERLDTAGIGVSAIHLGEGPQQMAISCEPSLGLKAADKAVMFREIVRSAAGDEGHLVSFAPRLPDPAYANRLSLHISLQDHGDQVTYSPSTSSGLSEIAAPFVAGMLRYAPDISAFTRPSYISYPDSRMPVSRPSRCDYGANNRDTCVRICRSLSYTHSEKGEFFNIEFRAADGAANPYLLMGLLVMAGLQGIVDKESLPAPGDGAGDGAELPATMAAALSAAESSAVVAEWMSEEMLANYLRLKKAEGAVLADASPDEILERYLGTY